MPTRSPPCTNRSYSVRVARQACYLAVRNASSGAMRDIYGVIRSCVKRGAPLGQPPVMALATL